MNHTNLKKLTNKKTENVTWNCSSEKSNIRNDRK